MFPIRAVAENISWEDICNQASSREQTVEICFQSGQ